MKTEEILELFNNFKQPKEAICETFLAYLGEAANPFAAFLELVGLILDNSDPHRKESSFAMAWDFFMTWQQKKLDNFNDFSEWISKFSPFLTEEIQVNAVTMALKNDLMKFSQANVLFKFSTFRNPKVVHIIGANARSFVAVQNYKALSGILLSQMEVLDVNSLMNDQTLQRLSLFMLCNNNARSFKFLMGKISPQSRIEQILQYLDSFLEMPPADQYARIVDDLSPGPSFRYSREVFEASVAKIPRELGLPIIPYRNMTLFDMKKKVNFLVRSTFSPEAEMDVATFRELLVNFGRIDNRFVTYAIPSLLKFGLNAEALCLINSFNLHGMFRVPSAENLSSPPKNVSGADTIYYQFPLPDQAIAFVDNISAFHFALNYIFSMAENPNLVVGIDAEWTGVLPPGAEQNMAILQLALSDRVFILDIENLSAQFSGEEWAKLKLLLGSPGIIKIAHGFKTDLLMFSKSYPHIFDSFEPKSIIDLELLAGSVWESLKARNLNIGDDKPPKSLASVSDWILGRRVPKMFRMSNWNRRPLERGQIIYAATDSYSLLEIYSRLKSMIAANGLDINV